MLYIIGGIVVVILIVWLWDTAFRPGPYRCQKCGFETYSELEAAGHEKQENAHKVVKE